MTSDISGPAVSVLSVEKYGKPFVVQVEEVGKILGVRIATDTTVEALDRTHFDPRCEWAVRWLLKRLAANSDGFVV